MLGYIFNFISGDERFSNKRTSVAAKRREQIVTDPKVTNGIS